MLEPGRIAVGPYRCRSRTNPTAQSNLSFAPCIAPVAEWCVVALHPLMARSISDSQSLVGDQLRLQRAPASRSPVSSEYRAEEPTTGPGPCRTWPLRKGSDWLHWELLW